MREAFEKWFILQHPRSKHGLRKWGDTEPYSKEYQSSTTEALWQSWQAAWEASNHDNH